MDAGRSVVYIYTSDRNLNSRPKIIGTSSHRRPVGFEVPCPVGESHELGTAIVDPAVESSSLQCEREERIELNTYI